MLIEQPKIIIECSELNYNKLKTIEKCARICYKSEPKENVNEKFIEGLIRNGHESVIEHEKVTVLIHTDRAISHEIVRHRIASYSQSSTRYCNFSLDKFNHNITFIPPCTYEKGSANYISWQNACLEAEERYFRQITNGAKPEEARSVLPNSLKTELYMTANFRSWRNFFKLRTHATAHPDIRRLAIPMLIIFKTHFAPVFADIEVPIDFPKEWYAEVSLIG